MWARLSRSNFPENQLGASLKGRHCRNLADRDDHFPENQLGASLKVRDRRFTHKRP